MKIFETLYLDEACFMIIASQMLLQNRINSDKNGLLNIIERLGYIQIDTISIVERSHHHTLWTRMAAYQRSMLNELVEKEKKIFEYWSHAAAFLPIKDYKYSLIRKKNFSSNHKDWSKQNKKMLNYVYDRIKREGPLQSKDFEDNKRNSLGWWDWKPSKDALNFLFHEGKLMIAKRQGFQKVYDLPERILPDEIETALPSEKDFYKYLIHTSINSQGIVTQGEIVYLRKHNKQIFNEVINELIENKEIINVNIHGIERENYYTSPNNLNLLNRRKKLNNLYILSPFDNLVIQRKRLKTLFSFDYQLECYVPHSKRKYGYFCLPVLYGDKFIGKIDLKRSRETKTLFINNLYLEKNIRLSDKITLKLKKKLEDLANFSGCEKVSGLNF